MTTTPFWACLPPSPDDINDNYFFTEVSTYLEDKISRCPEIHDIIALNKDTLFLLGNNKDTVASPQEHKAYVLRSTDGGRTFETRILCDGFPNKMSVSEEAGMLCISCTQYLENGKKRYPVFTSSSVGKEWEELNMPKDKRPAFVGFVTKDIGIVHMMEDPIGYSIQTLYKTTDGGKSWQFVSVNLDSFNWFRLTENATLFALDFRRKKILRMNINTLECQEDKIDIPDNLAIYGPLIINPLTKEVSIMLSGIEDDFGKEYYLYNLNNKQMLTLPVPSYSISLYGDYIAVEGYNNAVTKYHYSYDYGKTWYTETPKEWFAMGPFEMYGRGYMWTIANAFRYSKGWPLMGRIPSETDMKGSSK